MDQQQGPGSPLPGSSLTTLMATGRDPGGSRRMLVAGVLGLHLLPDPAHFAAHQASSLSSAWSSLLLPNPGFQEAASD